MPVLQEIWGILSCGIPSLITEVSSGIVIIIFNILILGLAGNIGVAAYGVVANISLVVIAVYTGIAQGIQPILSSNYGAGKKQNLHAIFCYAAGAVLLLSAGIYLCIFFGADPITAVFNSEHSAALQSIAAQGLKIYFTGCVFAGMNIVLSVYFTSTDHPKPAHLISILRGFAVMIPMAFLLSAIGGIIGVWAAFPAAEALVCCISMALFLKSRSSI